MRLRIGKFVFICAGALRVLAGSCAPVVEVEDTVLPMERGYDGIECLWNNGRSSMTNYGHSVEVFSPKSVKSLFLAYTPGHTPGVRPFRGGSLVLESAGACSGEVTIWVAPLRGGQEVKFVQPWTERVRFATGFNAKDQYVLRRLCFSPRTKGDWSVHIHRVHSVVSLPKAEACRLDVETGNPLHICREESEAPVIRLFNDAKEPLRFRGRVAYSDLCGHKGRMPFDTGLLNAGESAKIPLGWPLPGKGLWIVGAEVESDDGSKAMQETRFAFLDRHDETPPFPDGKFRMGVNYHMAGYWPRHKDLTLDAIVACGAKLVRAGIGASWDYVQRNGRDSWDWGAVDLMLPMIEKRGLAVNTLIWNTPRWAAQSDRLASSNWRLWVYGMPVDIRDFETFCEKLAARYGTRIAYYEIGNEWDLAGSNTMTQAEATLATKAGCVGVKRGSPNAKVIPNGWACWDSKNSLVIQKGLPEGVMVDCKGCYDAHAIHNHGAFRIYRERMLDVFARRKSLGIDDVPWYANETALSSVNGYEIPVAENVWKKILFAWAYGSRDYIWYNLRATGWDPKDPEQGYGMMTPDYYPRASYAAFSALSAVLSGFDADGILKSERTREVYRFRGMRKDHPELVIAGWDTALRQPSDIRIQTDAKKAAVVDFMGNARLLVVKDGCVLWPLERRPTALVLHDGTKAEPVTEDLDAIPDEKGVVVCLDRTAWEGRSPDFVVDKVWQQHGFYEANPLTVDRVWQGPADCSFKGWVSRSENWTLVCRVEVRDDVHSQNAAAVRKMSEGDCLRVDVTSSGDGCWRFGFRRTDDGRSEVCLWNAPGEKIKRSRVESAVEFTSERRDGTTIYEFSLPLSEMGVDAGKLARGMDVSFMVDDSDGEGRDLWMGPETPIRVRIEETENVRPR